MKKYQLHIFVSVFVVCAFTLGAAVFTFAQDFRGETVRPGTRKIVPQPRDKINIDLWFDKQCGNAYRQGEKIMINFRTDMNGYLTLYDIDTRGDVSVLFPNRHHPDNYVKAGSTYMLPAPYYSYDLIVEGPEGIEYVDAVASTDQYYHWNYKQGEPQWIREWGLKNRSFSGKSSQSYKRSQEYQNRPEQFGKAGESSLSKNFMISRQLQENIRSKIVTRPRVVEQPRAEDYGTATCYFYVVGASTSPQPAPPARPTPRPSYPSQPSYQDSLNRMHQDFKRIPGVDVTQTQNSLTVRMPDTGLFDSDSYALRYEARRDLNRVADILLRYQDTSMTVAGHTDSIGDANYNQRLSEYRAQTVANYLVSQGVPAHRLSSVGYGETMPIDSNARESGRRRNRRIELIVSLHQQYGM